MGETKQPVSSKNGIYFLGAAVVLAVIILVYASVNGAGPYDDFAKCLTDKGAKMYGAFWCPHCQAQKELFGKSMKYVDYVECSLPDKVTQTQPCIDAGVKTYPTWIFANGSRNVGEMTFDQLSTATSCPVPAKS